MHQRLEFAAGPSLTHRQKSPLLEFRATNQGHWEVHGVDPGDLYRAASAPQLSVHHHEYALAVVTLSAQLLQFD